MITNQANIEQRGNGVKVIISTIGRRGPQGPPGEATRFFDSVQAAVIADPVVHDDEIFETPEGLWRRDSSLSSGAEFIRAFPATEQQIADIGQSVDDLHNQVDVELAGIRSDNAAFQSDVNQDLQQITAEKQVFESEAQEIKDAVANMTTTGKIYDSLADAIAESPKPENGTPFSVIGDGDNDGYYKFDSTQPDGVKFGRKFDRRIQVESISQLKNYKGRTGEAVDVLGYYEKGDGGGGLFYWDAASTEEDNGGTIIEATGITNGRWKRRFDDTVNVKWFGAKGDGVTDDTACFKRIEAFKNVVIDNGVFIISERIMFKDVTLNSRNATIKHAGGIDARYGLIHFTGTNTVDGLILDGNASNVNETLETGSSSMLSAGALTDSVFRNITIKNTLYAAVTTNGNLSNVHFQNVHFENLGASCIYVSGGSSYNVTLNGFTVKDFGTYSVRTGVNRNLGICVVKSRADAPMTYNDKIEVSNGTIELTKKDLDIAGVLKNDEIGGGHHSVKNVTLKLTGDAQPISVIAPIIAVNNGTTIDVEECNGFIRISQPSNETGVYIRAINCELSKDKAFPTDLLVVNEWKNCTINLSTGIRLQRSNSEKQTILDNCTFNLTEPYNFVSEEVIGMSLIFNNCIVKGLHQATRPIFFNSSGVGNISFKEIEFNNCKFTENIGDVVRTIDEETTDVRFINCDTTHTRFVQRPVMASIFTPKLTKGAKGQTGSFTDPEGRLVTVENGIITQITEPTP